jgi:hypothetical protein
MEDVHEKLTYFPTCSHQRRACSHRPPPRPRRSPPQPAGRRRSHRERPPCPTMQPHGSATEPPRGPPYPSWWSRWSTVEPNEGLPALLRGRASRRRNHHRGLPSHFRSFKSFPTLLCMLHGTSMEPLWGPSFPPSLSCGPLTGMHHPPHSQPRCLCRLRPGSRPASPYSI